MPQIFCPAPKDAARRGVRHRGQCEDDCRARQQRCRRDCRAPRRRRVWCPAIEDYAENFTRFLLVRRGARTRAGANKTSIVFATQNVPGSLFRCLAVFALRDIDLTKIESRPWRGRPWEYLFYLDFLGRPDTSPGREALSHLGELTSFLRVLGCYPRSRRS